MNVCPTMRLKKHGYTHFTTRSAAKINQIIVGYMKTKVSLINAEYLVLEKIMFDS